MQDLMEFAYKPIYLKVRGAKAVSGLAHGHARLASKTRRHLRVQRVTLRFDISIKSLLHLIQVYLTSIKFS